MKTKVYVAIPTTGTVSDALFYSLRNIEKRYQDEVEFIYPKYCIRRIFHDFARNSLVEDFLESDANIMWFLDSDITPPPHILDLVVLHKDKWEAAGAPYPIVMCPESKDKPEIVLTVYNGSSEKGMHPSKVPYEGTAFVDGLATGCLFLKRELISKLKKPYFEFKYNSETRSIIEGEDIGFCKKLNALNVKFFTDYSMVCGHTKSICLRDMNDYAISFAHKAVQNYDASIRPQFEALAREVARLKKPSALIVPTFK